ncbi:MAG TPA: peptidoglycan editing factor PgeF [Syntrophomonadaceae bacterium]|nr:peptidoglycan editing factor PgeF [Syntrophomonadaceae bacterium]HNX29162.1 peptidoglycan editing factor PgeF [Syntrophomonadaceae bacterium]HPR93665.1 peptidoglycan editing factor PgeF [Syntrophomonadaceae bacterium]
MLNWKWEDSDGIKYITVPEWGKQGADMMFTARHQGYSIAPYDSLNLGLHVGDEADKVIKNRQKIMSIWGRSINDLICCEQIHGNKVAVVDDSVRGRGALKHNDSMPGHDGMITNTPGLYLALFFADCLPVFLFDPVNKVIALVHSGWKGTMGKIVLQAVDKMNSQYRAEPKNIQALIGPGIAKCCFEINQELADRVSNEFAGFDNIMHVNNDRNFWDLTGTNYLLLRRAGLQANNIAVCELCTKCHTDIFFSYRGEAGDTGRMAAVIGLA